MPKNPLENFDRLWTGGDELIPWSKQMVSEIDHLLDHLETMEAYMSCAFSLLEHSPKHKPREYALTGLFLRTFDNIGHAVRAAFTGNYHGAAMYARDLLETCFLLDYLFDDPERPAQWLDASTEVLRREFGPVHVRKALDDRDGFKERKREQHYKMLSNLGAHPTPHSFSLKKDGTNRLNCGPFKQKDLLRDTIEEISKITLTLADILIRYRRELPNGHENTSRLALILQKNREKFFSR